VYYFYALFILAALGVAFFLGYKFKK